MSNPLFLSRKAASIQPYVPGEQPRVDNLIKLNTNENPYPPAPGVLRAVREQVERLRLYPQIDGATLREAIGQREGLPADWVYVGNGSDEVLSLCFPAFFNPDEPVRFPQITYTFYKVFAELFSIPYEEAPMKEGFAVDEEALTAGTGGAILANPNAPTSLQLPLEAIERMAQRQLQKGKVLIVDEAYVSFGDQPSAATLLDRYPNLLVTRTLSKDHAMAGLRVGYALAQPALLEGLVRVKDSFNSYPLDTLAIFGAAAAIQDEEYFQMRLGMVKATRDRFAAELRRRGFDVLPSATNFLFVRPGGMSGRTLFDALRARDILIRRWDNPLIDQWLRISIGTDREMDRVLAAIDEIRAFSL